jgi:hypothetical protein
VTRAGSAVLAALGLALAVRCDAITLCRQRDGDVVARAACRRGERAVDLSALGPLGSEGTAGAPGAAGSPGVFPLRLVDSAGVELGPIVWFFPSQAWVRMTHPLLGRPVVFIVEPGGYFRYTAGAISAVFYQTGDCSGAPFINEQPGPILAQVYGDSAYFSAEEAFDRTVGSSEVDPGNAACPGGSVPTARSTCCYMGSSSMQRSQAAVRVALSALGFSPPFKAEAR